MGEGAKRCEQSLGGKPETDQLEDLVIHGEGPYRNRIEGRREKWWAAVNAVMNIMVT
jgi:hypothetical protein